MKYLRPIAIIHAGKSTRSFYDYYLKAGFKSLEVQYIGEKDAAALQMNPGDIMLARLGGLSQEFYITCGAVFAAPPFALLGQFSTEAEQESRTLFEYFAKEGKVIDQVETDSGAKTLHAWVKDKFGVDWVFRLEP